LNRTLLIRLAIVLCAGSTPWTVLADSELDQLRAQNARLKAQIETLQRSCQVSGGAAATGQTQASASPMVPAAAAQPPVPAAPPEPPVPQAATASVAAPVAVPAAPPPSAAPAPPPGAAAPATEVVVTAAPAPAAPPGYRLEKIDPVADAENAENCQHGLLGKTTDAPWKHESSWTALTRQMLPAQVEGLLGKTHTSTIKGDRTLWEYGKCGARSVAEAFVVFDRDGLLFWKQPDF